MAEQPRILVRANDRVSFIGKTGSGKTYLARAVCAPLTRLLVFDSKGTLGGKDWNLSDDQAVLRELKRGRPGRLRIQTPSDRDWRPWLRLMWEMRPITLYIDELMNVVPRASKAPPELDDLYTRGRELGIGVYASMQRPAWVPPFALSESTWIFLFRVAKRVDRRAVSDFGDEQELMMEPIRDEHGFWTYKQGWRRPIYTQRFRPRVQPIAVQPAPTKAVAS